MEPWRYKCKEVRARICKRLTRPGIDSEDSIPPAYVAWRAGTTNRVVVQARQAVNRFLGSFKGLQIRAQGQDRTRSKIVSRRPYLKHLLTIFIKLRLVSNLSHRKSNFRFI